VLRAWLRITRLPLAPTAIYDSAACALLALGAARLPLDTLGPVDWIQLGVTSLLLYAAGMAANDLADRKVDARKAPSRPLPSGALKPAAVMAAVLLFAGGAILLGGGPAGYRWAVAAAVVFAGLYDFACKQSLVGGALAMGAVRAANASIAVWPFVLSGAAPGAVLLGPLLIGLYSAGVIVLSTTEDLPPEAAPDRVWIARVFSAVAFVGAATLVWILGGLLTLGAMVAFGVASSALFGRTPRTTMRRDGAVVPRPVKAQVREMLLGLYWLAAVLAGGGHDGTFEQSLIIAFCALVLAWVLAIGSQLMIRQLRGS